MTFFRNWRNSAARWLLRRKPAMSLLKPSALRIDSSVLQAGPEHFESACGPIAIQHFQVEDSVALCRGGWSGGGRRASCTSAETGMQPNKAESFKSCRLILLKALLVYIGHLLKQIRRKIIGDRFRQRWVAQSPVFSFKRRGVRYARLSAWVHK